VGLNGGVWFVQNVCFVNPLRENKIGDVTQNDGSRREAKSSNMKASQSMQPSSQLAIQQAGRCARRHGSYAGS
jgi:hypothetical protein